MNRTRLCIPTLLLGICSAACTAGPENPATIDYQKARTIDIHARFVDSPAGGTDSVQMSVHWIGPRKGSATDFIAGHAWLPSVEGELRFRFTSDLYSSQSGAAPESLRLFRLIASTSSASGLYREQWEQPGLLLVYATCVQSWSPFGPAGPTLTLPHGYSLLRRSCGPVPGQILMEVRPVDDVVELRHQEPGDDSGDSAFEASERDFVMACGATVPAVDLGTRTSFDVAQSLVWSSDQSTLYYLSPADPDDKTETVGLRQVRLADSSTSELATVPHGTGVQTGRAGEVFVTTRSALLRFTVAPSVTMVSIPMINPGSARVSPDGRWLGYTDYPAVIVDTEHPGIRGHVMDLDAGANVVELDGAFAAWSPDGRFAYWSKPLPAAELAIASLAEPGEVLGPYPVGTEETGSVVWTSGGALLARIPLSWTDEVSHGNCSRCFGLTLLDPVTGIERTLLDASAGMLGLSRTTSLLETQFVSAKKCFGLWETVCSSTLLRVHATDGVVGTVTTIPASRSMAISSDGRRVAFGTSKGIYVKELRQ